MKRKCEVNEKRDSSSNKDDEIGEECDETTEQNYHHSLKESLISFKIN